VIALEHFSLVPVVELSPMRYGNADRPAPARLGVEVPDQWDRYWLDSMADAGITGLTPLRPASWHVSAAQLTDAVTLEAIIKHTSEHGEWVEAVADPEWAPVLSGGLALCRGAEVLIEPMCCGDLANISDWRKAAMHRGGDWQMLWIGHPWLSVRFEDGWLVISEPHEDDPPVPHLKVRPEALHLAVTEAEAELEALAGRFRPVLHELLGPERSLRLARTLAGLST
jgi:hypothetical protein